MLRYILWFVAVVGAIMVVALLRDLALLRAVRNVSIEALDFTKLRDGEYAGEYIAGRHSNKVKATVESGRVTGIDIVQEAQYGADVQRQVISRVVETQSLQVDTVSGATVTTRAALKAIENALSAAR
ncbi:MAG: FMN-binding domain protein [Firmicutes bacterium ADurb.Bin506]|nr:MAG: FMN-binding domain protein [Firmicutes bacterium ADurb.Bin506]